MRVPLLDLTVQHEPIRKELLAAIEKVIDSNAFIMGQDVERLEIEISNYVGTKFGVAMSSGTDAILAALMALNVGPGDIVLTPNYSFFATAGAVVRLGATPQFIDIDAKSFNIDVEQVENWFNKNPSQRSFVKAIVPVHLYGQCADMDALREIADKYNVPIIEDAAQAIGAAHVGSRGRHFAGSLGLCGCFSFFPTKNLGAMGDGGMVVTNDAALAERLRILRNHGAHPKYFHKMIGGNFRLDTVQAAVLLTKLPHLEAWHAQRRESAAHYDELFASQREVQTPQIVYSRSEHIFNQYVILVSGRRDELRKFLSDKGIVTEVYYPVPFHRQECFSYLGYGEEDFPNSNLAARNSLALPVYPGLTSEMREYVAQAISDFYR